MISRLIHIDPDKGETLQSQIRQQIVEGILVGSFPPCCKLPSSRKLATELGVSRNTVVLVYESLLAEGYIVTKDRSGIYVSEDVHKGKTALSTPSLYNHKVRDNLHRFKGALATTNYHSNPQNWHDYQYPFIDGKYDTSLYPVKEWREANAKANTTREIYQWSKLQGMEDDPMLLDEIRSKILPRRGIQAKRQEILITAGSKQALHFITELFVDSSVTVALEEPGYPEMRNLLVKNGARLIYQAVDAGGVVVDEQLNDCNILYTTPSHQTPTSVTMSMDRRDVLLTKANEQDLLIIEDDFEFESNFLGQPHPALRSLDKENRVVYVSCLSKVLESGTQIGFIVADSGVIAELKKIRKLLMRSPALNNQRTVAYFLSMGHYDAYMMQLHKVFFQRWLTLREALNTYLPNCINTGPIQGGTAYWVTGPETLDGLHLRTKAAEHGILIEPVKRYFANSEAPENCFRMGITSISNERIRIGVEKLAKLIHELTEKSEEKLTNAKGKLLDKSLLKQVLTGVMMECEMVYGSMCEIELWPDGTMVGRTWGLDEETDTGRWWLKDGMYYRQWNLWGYGETKGFYVIMDGVEMKWFDQNYCFVRQLEVTGYLPQLEPS